MLWFGRKFFNQTIKNDKNIYKTFEKLQLVKEMIRQVVS